MSLLNSPVFLTLEDYFLRENIRTGFMHILYRLFF
jgi:hypothetical protein